MINSLYESLIEKRFHLQREQAVVHEQTELPEYYKDKFLKPIEKVSVREDFRGIPETKYYESSMDECFVEGIGWLNDDDYRRELRNSELPAQDFFKKVTKVRAYYVDTEGNFGAADMDKQVYNLLQDKTYDRKNEAEYTKCVAAYEERLKSAGVSERPTEYYGVRQQSDNRYAIISMAADGVVAVVIAGTDDRCERDGLLGGKIYYAAAKVENGYERADGKSFNMSYVPENIFGGKGGIIITG